MLSTSSLQAFSASTTQAASRAEGMRLVRAQPEGVARQAVPLPGGTVGPIPEVRPGVPPPRGSLVNLSA